MTGGREVEEERDKDLAVDVVIASLANAIDRDQALALREAMIDLSQRCWNAYWMGDCEYDLWSFSEHTTGERGRNAWGIGVVEVEDGMRLQELAKACGGWWKWEDGDPAERFVPMGWWLEMVKTRASK